MQVSQALESIRVEVGDAAAAQVQQTQCPKVGENCWAQHPQGIAREVEGAQGRKMHQESPMMGHDQGVEGEVHATDVAWKGAWSMQEVLPLAVGPSLEKEMLSEMGSLCWGGSLD